MKPLLALVLLLSQRIYAGYVSGYVFLNCNCSLPPDVGSAYCDTGKDFETRAAALVSTLAHRREKRPIYGTCVQYYASSSGAVHVVERRAALC
jgi:hypothetical protein